MSLFKIRKSTEIILLSVCHYIFLRISPKAKAIVKTIINNLNSLLTRIYGQWSAWKRHDQLSPMSRVSRLEWRKRPFINPKDSRNAVVLCCQYCWLFLWSHKNIRALSCARNKFTGTAQQRVPSSVFLFSGYRYRTGLLRSRSRGSGSIRRKFLWNIKNLRERGGGKRTVLFQEKTLPIFYVYKRDV